MRQQGKIQLVGLIQEQHPDRCKLFMQWKSLDFPVLVDAANRIGVYAVPLMWAIDENGVVRATRPKWEWIVEEFVDMNYPTPRAAAKKPEESPGVEKFLQRNWTGAIDYFRGQTSLDPQNGEAWFRLGCALRARHDSGGSQLGDFQAAVAAWTQALEINPKNYIWRRRVQQYGPSGIKPYPFYDWVERAREEIQNRGEQPLTLKAQPQGAELAQPSRQWDGSVDGTKEADPTGVLPRDEKNWIDLEAVVAPYPVKPGDTARIYLTFTPTNASKAHWSNDAGPLEYWWKNGKGVQFSQMHAIASLPHQVETSRESRKLEFEVKVPESAREEVVLAGYATFYVCEDVNEECLFLAKDVKVQIPIASTKD